MLGTRCTAVLFSRQREHRLVRSPMANVVSVVRRATCSLIAKNSCVGWVPLNCNCVFRYSHYLPSCRAMTLSQGMHIVVRAECASADEPGCGEPLAQTLVFRRVGFGSCIFERSFTNILCTSRHTGTHYSEFRTHSIPNCRLADHLPFQVS